MPSAPTDLNDADTPIRFADLLLAQPVLSALETIGYDAPSPIQARTIPSLLEGRDVLGQAQTGTGKTAAFALPILSMLDLSKPRTQALVLAPTRELAIQVAEAFQTYAANLRGFHVLPIYGGQSYEPQLKGLKRGAHVVVGTPGRVVDHIKRGSLVLDALTHLVLDEADEMLRMGFIDDVEWVLQQTPPTRQIALFSATMPPAIRRVAQAYLKSPVEVTIKSKTTTGTNIRQRYWLVSGLHKLDALTRFLEVESFDAMLVFARTKIATTELADKLEARGFAARALNGDMAQADRERVISRLKDGQIDIVVATDIAARGLDVERISHVVNYDIPTDTESYVHRIGRTGRAGRSGEAILFVSPRERHLLKAIERATRQPIEPIAAPSADTINARRISRFKQTIAKALDDARSGAAATKFETFRAIVEQFEAESGSSLADIAAALAQLAQGNRPLLLEGEGGSVSTPATRQMPPPKAAPHSTRSFTPAERGGDSVAPVKPAMPVKPAATAKPARLAKPTTPQSPFFGDSGAAAPPIPRPVQEATPAAAPAAAGGPDALQRVRKKALRADSDDGGSETYRIEVGETHGVKPGNIVGAIANEAGLDSEYIGRIEIFDEYSHVDLPSGMPKDVFRDLKKVWVCSRQLRITRVATTPEVATRPNSYKAKKR